MPEDSADKDVDRTYAELLDFHLTEHGTRPDGHPDRDGKLWQYEEFARTAGLSSRALRNYRSGALVPTADIQNRIERALFGNNEAYDAWRRRLRDVAKRTDGTKAELASLADWNILRREFTDGLAEVRLHPPRPGNVPNTFYVEATLQLKKSEYDYEERTISIGLKDAFLSLESPNYQAAKGSMIGERAEHPNFEADVGGAKIKGPRPDGCLAGNPLGDEYVAVIESVGDRKEEPSDGGKEVVTVSLHAGRSAFEVALVGDQDEPSETYLTTNKWVVLDALIRDGLPRDRQGRVILARARMQRRPRT